MQPRKCPHCDKTIAVDVNYSFDKDLNLVCGDCGKIAFGTDWKTNTDIDNAVRTKGGSHWNTRGNNFQSNNRHHNNNNNHPKSWTPGSTVPAKTPSEKITNAARQLKEKTDTSNISGLCSERTQVPNGSSSVNDAFVDRFGCFQTHYKDIDDYQQLPFFEG